MDKPTAPRPTAPQPTAPRPTAPQPTAPQPTAPQPTAPAQRPAISPVRGLTETEVRSTYRPGCVVQVLSGAYAPRRGIIRQLDYPLVAVDMAVCHVDKAAGYHPDGGEAGDDTITLYLPYPTFGVLPMGHTCAGLTRAELGVMDMHIPIPRDR